MDSIWQNDVTFKHRAPLRENIRTDVVIIGAGLTGILLADRLKQTGRDVVILEAGRIAGGQTAGTTAKITVAHGLQFADLLKSYGEETAKLYAQSQQDAIAAYAARIKKSGIACDWKREDMFLYTRAHCPLLEDEIRAANALGIDARFTDTLDLPIAVEGAVHYPHQATFHPLKFLLALSQGLTVYENTAVRRVDDTHVYTDTATVTAEYIVFAGHFPFVNFPGMYFARQHQERSYVLALSGIHNKPQGMYFGIGDNTFSVRTAGDYLLFGGNTKRSGTADGTEYTSLEAAAKDWYPTATVYRQWSAEDCIPARKLPYIGRYSMKKINWFVATGYRKWGMTTAMTAATLLCDMITATENPLEQVFAPDEFRLHELMQIVPDTARSSGSIVSAVLPKSKKRFLQVGEGGVISRKYGGYRNEKGRTYTVSLRCPHLGCQLHFNPNDKTWECPCHGSTFDYRGRRLSGPAQRDICTQRSCKK